MRKLMLATLAAAGLAMAGVPAPASAQAIGPAGAANLDNGRGLVTEVRWRGRHWRHGHHRWHRHHRHGWGPAIGAGIAGAIIGGALAAQANQSSAVAYCQRRFRSYDPASGTYLGYDGYRHPCP